MLYGPIFGAVAVLLTAVTTNLVLLGGTRILEGASGAASVPSILGFIAMATAGNEVLRGKTSARFEAATLAGLGAGAIVGVKLFEIVGPAAFLFNAVLYGVSFLIYRFGVADPAGEKAAVTGEHVRRAAATSISSGRRTCGSWHRPGSRSTRHIGVWLSQSVFQLAKGNPKFPDQVLMRRLHGQPDHDRSPRGGRRLRGRPDLLGQPVQEATAEPRSSATACSAGPSS